MKLGRGYFYALLPIAGAFELIGSLLAHRSAPAPDRYEELGAAMESLHHRGDLVVVAPRWAEPHARHALGDAFFPLEAVARSDADRFARAIEISIRGQHAPELSRFTEVERREVGPFSLRVLENPKPERVVFDFVDGLVPTWASAASTDPPASCTWSKRSRVMTGGLGGHPAFPAQRFECPEGVYLNVSATVIADEQFLPRRCIWAHPPARGARIVRFSGVPLGERIVGHMGMYWIIERTKKGAPIDLAVVVDGDRLASFRHVDGEGWKGFEVPLGSHAGAERATVEFEISTSDNTDRHLCFQADSR